MSGVLRLPPWNFTLLEDLGLFLLLSIEFYLPINSMLGHVLLGRVLRVVVSVLAILRRSTYPISRRRTSEILNS